MYVWYVIRSAVREREREKILVNDESTVSSFPFLFDVFLPSEWK